MEAPMNVRRSLGLASFLLLGLFVLGLWGTGLIGPTSEKTPGAAAARGTQGIIPSAFADPTPDCPAIFSQCSDTFGRNCNFSTMCTVTDTGLHKCKMPQGGNFVCTGQQTIR